MFTSFVDNLYAAVEKIPFDTLTYIVFGTFALIFILACGLCVGVPKFRHTSKRPYLGLVNAYSGVTLAVFLLGDEVPQALFAAAIFWVAGYMTYGILCFLSRQKESPVPQIPAQMAITALPQATSQKAETSRKQTKAPAAKNNVRLEHALAVTDRLLKKELGRTDRQELERLKNTLEILRVKGSLTPAEGEILNENFNTLLKLMAKYNV